MSRSGATKVEDLEVQPIASPLIHVQLIYDTNLLMPSERIICSTTMASPQIIGFTKHVYPGTPKTAHGFCRKAPHDVELVGLLNHIWQTHTLLVSRTGGSRTHQVSTLIPEDIPPMI